MELQRPEVIEEYEKFQRKRTLLGPDGDWAICFNNFSLNLPEGSMRKYHESSDKLEKKLSDLDPSYVDYYLKKSSALRSFQTNQEFYETIDKVLKEEGVFEAVLAENTPKRNIAVSHKRLYILIIPTYFKLRDMGYNWFDLAG